MKLFFELSKLRLLSSAILSSNIYESNPHQHSDSIYLIYLLDQKTSSTIGHLPLMYTCLNIGFDAFQELGKKENMGG